jgi:hypothetical protein
MSSKTILNPVKNCIPKIVPFGILVSPLAPNDLVVLVPEDTTVVDTVEVEFTNRAV